MPQRAASPTGLGCQERRKFRLIKAPVGPGDMRRKGFEELVQDNIDQRAGVQPPRAPFLASRPRVVRWVRWLRS